MSGGTIVLIAVPLGTILLALLGWLYSRGNGNDDFTGDY